jgi:hypothetical protein
MGHLDRYVVPGWILLLTIVPVLLACELPVLFQPEPSNLAPGSIETIVFETAAAAQTQTAIVLPPPTRTPTLTPPPTGTPTETSTPTATVVFIPPTPRTLFKPYEAGSACKVVAFEPYNPVLAPRANFETTLTLQNTGNELWLDKNIDFKHSAGTDMHRTDVYDLPKSVAPGDQVTITLRMSAPRDPGTYTSTWVLAGKQNTLCKVSVTIIVK